jgi:adenosylhomocysteine nucleosidase
MRDLLLVTAMPSEARHALELSAETVKDQLGPWPVWSLQIEGRNVRLLLTGIGMVNAGAALARALGETSPSAIVNYGCAGAHQRSIHPGDVVIGDRYIHHRAVTILPTGDERYSGVPVDPNDVSRFVSSFDADSALFESAVHSAEELQLEDWPGQPVGTRTPAVLTGAITSADTWTQSTDHIERIHSEHETLCEDMEAAALAQVAFMHGIPFLAIKDISNNEFHAQTDHGDSGPSLKHVELEVGRRAFALVREMIERLPN